MKLIPEMSKDEINRELCGRLKICWHEWNIPVLQGEWYNCKLCGIFAEHRWHPDFYSDPGKIQLLREMMKLESWYHFVSFVPGGYEKSINAMLYFIEDLLLDQKGLLTTAALEWLAYKKKILDFMQKPESKEKLHEILY